MKKRLLSGYYTILGYFAKKFIKKHQPIVIGINGSVGKTSCRVIIHQTLQHYFPNKKIYTSSQNFNGELGLPLSIFSIERRKPNLFQFIKTFFSILFTSIFGKKKYDIIILEYGIDRPKEMDFLLNIVKPDIGVLTALDAVHSEQFGDPNAIAQEEVKMPLNTKEVVFLNQDEPYTKQIINNIPITKLTYQTTNPESNANIKYLNPDIIKTPQGIKSKFTAKITEKEYEITTNQIGKINYGYITVALAISQIIAHKYQQKDSLEKNITINYKLLPGRMTILEGQYESLLIDSSYNASPLSMRRLIDTTYHIKTANKEYDQTRLVLGDMRELGNFTEQEHRTLAGYCLGIADRIYLVGESMKKYFSDEYNKIGGKQEHIQHFSTSIQAGQQLQKDLKKLQEEKKKAILLIKGSQNTIFLEETTKLLLKNPKDKKHLVRQSIFWQNKKNTK